MQVTYTLEPADLTQFGKFNAMRRRQRFDISRFIRIAVVLIVLMAITYALTNSSHPRSPTARMDVSGIVISLVIPLAVLAGVWTFLLRNVRKLPAASLFSRRQTLDISAENLRSQTEGMETMTQWSRVCEIASDQYSLYLFTDEVTAYIVPRRAFQSPPLADAFLTAATAYWKGDAKSASDAPPGMWPTPPRLGA